MDKATTGIVKAYDLRSVSEESFIIERDRINNENKEIYDSVVGPIIISIDGTCTKTFFEYLCAMPETSLAKLDILHASANTDLLEILNLQAYHVYTILTDEEISLLCEGMTSNTEKDHSQLWIRLLKRLK